MHRPKFLRSWRGWLALLAGAAVALVLFTGVALMVFSPKLTPFIEGPVFQAELDKQTSKGLHFRGQYQDIRRTGFDTASAASFQASEGVKAMKSLQAEHITAKFNPWGVLLRRWQLDDIHIKRGKVEVQVYEPKPDNKPARPWYAIFLPNRVYLRQVRCDSADITWKMKDKPGGIFDTKVLITPYGGRDFEYRAEGGILRSGGFAPEQALRSIHLVITKKFLRIDDLTLVPPGNKQGLIQLSGEMGMRDAKHVNMQLEIQDVPVAPWLPSETASSIGGRATGHVTWQGDDQTIEASSVRGQLEIKGGTLQEHPLLDFLASAAANQELKSLTLTNCEVDFQWDYPRFAIKSLTLTAREKVAVRGSITLNKGVLSGELELGLDPSYLHWLPKAREEIFTREEGGMIWTTVKLSGSLSDPKNDLTPRLEEALKKDPAAAAGLFFREAGEWIEQKVKGK